MEGASIPILCPVCQANDFTYDASEALKIKAKDGSTVFWGLVRFECQACGHTWEEEDEDDEGEMTPEEMALARELFPQFFTNPEGEQDR